MYLVLYLMVVMGSVVWQGFVLHIIWNMYMPGAFNLPTLGTVHSIGILLIMSLFTHVDLSKVTSADTYEEAFKLGIINDLYNDFITFVLMLLAIFFSMFL